MTAERKDRATTSLLRSLGRTSATLVTASMIIGSGIFVAVGESTAKAGSGLPMAMILGGLVALAIGISAAQLGVKYPEEGGAFVWAREFGYPTAGFIAGCAYLGSRVVTVTVIALAFATYSAQAVPGLPIHIVAPAEILAVTALNVFGIQQAATALIGLLIAKVVLLAVFVTFASPEVQATNLQPVLGSGVVGVLAGAAIFFWSWDGFMRTAIIASEIDNPRQTIPFAIVVGILIAAVVFLAVGTATLGVLGAQKASGDEVPLFTAAAKAIGKWGSWVVLSAAWVTTLSENAGDLLSASRVALAMGKVHQLPAWFGAVHPRFRTPHRALVAFGLLCAVVALLFNLRPLLSLGSLFILVWYVITQFSALKLHKQNRFASPSFTWLGLVGCLALFVSLPLRALLIGSSALAMLTGIRWLLIRYKVARQ